MRWIKRLDIRGPARHRRDLEGKLSVADQRDRNRGAQ